MDDVSGKTIVAYREWLRLNQHDFAARLGVTQGLISQVECGRIPISKKLLRTLWEKSDDDVFEVRFELFLRRGGMKTEELKAEFGAVKPVTVEAWNHRLDLREPPRPSGADRLWIPGIRNRMRAFRFDDPPPIVSPDTLVVFRPADWTDLAQEQMVLVQFRSRYATKELDAGIGHLGRAIVTRRAGRFTCQFERSPIAGPIVNMTEKSVEVLMICHFRGRYGSL